MTTSTEHVEAAILALTDVTVALSTLYPIMSILHGPPDAASLVEDGILATSLARRHLLALRDPEPVAEVTPTSRRAELDEA